MLSVAAKTAAVPAASEAARSSSSSSHSRRRVFTNSVTRNRSGAAYSMSTDAVQPALVVELPELPERETSRLVGPQPTAADDYDAGAPNLRPQARRCRPWAVCTFAVVGGAVLAAIATALLSPYLPRRDDVPGLLDVAAARVGVITVRMPAADVETDAYSCSAFEWQDTVVSITASLPAPSDVRGVHHMSLFRCGALASGVELGQRFPCDDIEGLCRSEPQMLFGFEHMDGGGGGASSAAPEQLELPIAIQLGRSIQGARYMLMQAHYNRPLARDDSGFQLTVQAAVGIEGDAAQNTPASDEATSSASSTSSTPPTTPASSASSASSPSSSSSPSPPSSASSSASSASAPARLFHVELGAADFGAYSIPPGETASVVGPYRFTIPEATHCFLFVVHLHYHSLGRLASFRLLPKRWEKGAAFPHEYEEVRVERRTTVVGVGGGEGGGGAAAAAAAAIQSGTIMNTIAATARRAGAGDEGAFLPLPIATFGQRTGRTLQFKTPMELHGGDVIEFSCTFDSTSSTKQTAFGMKSTDEMCQVFLIGYIRGEGGLLRWDGGNTV